MMKEVLKLDGKLLCEVRAIRYLLNSWDDLDSAEALLDKKIYSQTLFHCQQACEKSSKACLALFGLLFIEEHKCSDFLKTVIIPNSEKLANKFKELVPKVVEIENNYIISRYGVDKKGFVHLKEYELSEITDFLNVSFEFVELCEKFIEQQMKKALPKSKEQLVLYLKENYKQFIKD